MNVSIFTRLAGLLLVAGFFYSCGSSAANLDELIANNNYQKALTEIDRRLAENPSQPALYIQRGEINAELARETDPELRAKFYTKTADDFDSAIEYDANETQLSTIDSLRQQYWKDEHNAGLRISENETVSERYQRSKIHFQNAIILRPDAVSSYRNLSVAQFNLGEINDAITSLETALDYTDAPSAELYENLGYLYLEKGNPAEAAQYYELANTNMEDDLNLAFGLINAYISNDNSAEAANMLETLVDENPQNANLRNVYGTQLYEITSDILEELKTAYSNNNTELTEDLRAEAEEMGEKAEEHLIEAFRRDTSNTKYLESLAVFYNNLASQYLALTKVSAGNDRSTLFQKANTLIDFAIQYYEKLIDIDPNNAEYGNKLEVLKKLKER